MNEDTHDYNKGNNRKEIIIVKKNLKGVMKERKKSSN